MKPQQRALRGKAEHQANGGNSEGLRGKRDYPKRISGNS